MQQYDDSRSHSLGAPTTDPEEAQPEPASPEPTMGMDAAASAAPQPMPPMPQSPGSPADAANGEADESEMTMAALLDSPSNAMRQLQRGEVIEGTVARIDADEVLVDIGQKSEGVISNRELGSAGDNGALQIGQQVLVYVMQPESPEGHAILSLKRAHMEQSWREAEQLMNEDRVIEARVIDYNKGGLIVDVGVRGFVPISQIPELRGLAKGADSGDSPQVAERLASMRGRVLKLKIIELNRARNRLILSERLAMQEQRAEKKEALLHELEPGQIRTGRVTSLASFGAFVDLGGADGLVHISQLSYSRVNHPSEVLNVGDEVQVYVLSIDPQTKKIALSLKKAQPDPWTLVEERYKVGDVVEGTITKLAKFGAFARIDDGIEGLIHLSELTDQAVEKPQDVVNEGEQVKLRVIAINSQRRRLGLSLRQAQGDTLLPVEVPAELEEDVDGDEGHERPRGRAATVAPAAPEAAPEPQEQPTPTPVAPEETAAPEPEAPAEPAPAPVPELDAAAEETAMPQASAATAPPEPTTATVAAAEEPAAPQDAVPPESTASGDPGGGIDALAPIADVAEPEATTSPEQHGEV